MKELTGLYLSPRYYCPQPYFILLHFHQKPLIEAWLGRQKDVQQSDCSGGIMSCAQELWENTQLVKHIIDFLSSVDVSLPVASELRQHLLLKVQPLSFHPKRFWWTEICGCGQVHIHRIFFAFLHPHEKKERKFSLLNLKQFRGRFWELHSSAS